MSRKRASNENLPPWKLFAPGDESTKALFAPAANWRKRDEYPALKPLDNFTRDDYLELAWELLRRMPRYRWQHFKLAQLGIKSPSFFGKSAKHFFSSENPPAFPGWAKFPLRGHHCEPLAKYQDETFGEYIAAQTEADQPWFVMNRYQWVLDFWGLNYLPDPKARFGPLRDRVLFSAPGAAVSVVSGNAPADRPQVINTYLRANEVLVRLRLDASFDQQVESIQKEFERAQGTAAKRKPRGLDPLPVPGRRLMGKAILRGDEFTADITPRAAAKVGRVLLKHLELYPFWLRTWDALADERIAQGKLKPRLDRKVISQQFFADYGHLDHPQRTTEVTAAKRRRKVPDLIDLIGAATDSPVMVQNWRDRSEKYIEESDEAFRQIVAMAFAQKAE